MRSVFIIMMFSSLIAHAQLHDRQDIEKTLWDYAIGRNNSDTGLLRSSFHPAADLRYLDSKTNEVVILTVKDYLLRFKPGEKLPCTAHIEYINVFGTAAQAKIILSYRDRTFADYFNLVKTAGSWKIVSKSYAPLLKKKRLLFVFTSHSLVEKQRTGLHFGELSRAYVFFKQRGYDIDLAATAGKNEHLYGFNLNDSNEMAFLADPAAMYHFRNPMHLDSLKPQDYLAIYLPGGHGTMWDFRNNSKLEQLISVIWQQGGIVAALCHGPAALMNVRLPDSSLLVKGKKLTCFSDEEEASTSLKNTVPFMLEGGLREKGAQVKTAKAGEPLVVQDARLLTGQNPASVYQLCDQLYKMLLNQKHEP